MPRSRFIALSLFLDALLVNAGIVVAYLLWFRGRLPAENFEPFISIAPFVTIGYLLAGYINEVYEPERTEGGWAVTRAVLSAAFIGTLVAMAVAFLAGAVDERYLAISRASILLSFMTISTLLIGWRLLFLRIASVTWPVQRVLLLGTSSLACELAEELDRRAKWGYEVVGFVGIDPDDSISGQLCGHPVFGGSDRLTGVIAENAVDRLIVVSPVAIRELVEKLVLAEEIDVTVDVVPELYEVFIGSVDSMVGDIPLMQITRSTSAAWIASAKRAVDIIFGTLLLVVLSPVLLVASVSILLSMGTPVIFKQERTGRDLKPFKVYKFRTMVRDAEQVSGPVLAEEDDPRVTPLGRVLRRNRIDELPQLVNIIKGEMSFVGPRPERPHFVKQFVQDIPGYKERFRVHPGVTGLAQVMGGYATTPERKLKYDLIYMYHQSLTMDAQIVLQTLRVVLTGRGAR